MTRVTTCLLIGLIGLFVFSIPLAAQDSATFEPADCPREVPLGLIEGQSVECGYVTVPEEHANPDGPTIRLAVARLNSTSGNPAPDPLFMAQGGPGGSTLELFMELAPLFTPFLAERDIILVEQRGTFYAEPNLYCPEELEATLETLDIVATIEESTEFLINNLELCTERLRAEGINFSAYDSVENAADMVDVADALGYAQFNFYGVSYGSLLGQHLIRDHEDRLRSVILDALVPTDLNFIPDVANTTERAFTELFANCAADAACNENFPDLETVFFNLVEELDANPVFFTTTDPVTGDSVDAAFNGELLITVVNAMLYSTPLVPNLPQYIYNSADGDFDWIANLLGILVIEPAYTSATGMQFAVLCAEDADFSEDDVPTEGIRPRIAQNQSVLPLAMDEICALFDVEPLGEFVDAPVETDIPVLLASGQFDPITPKSYADIVAESMPNSYNLLFPGVGHGALLGGTCPTNIMAAFVNDPTTAPDTSCIDAMRVNFSLAYTDVNDVFSFLLNSSWQDISTEDFRSFEDPVTGTVISAVSVETGDASTATDEALGIILPEFTGLALDSQTVPVGGRDYLQNVYFNGVDLIITLATVEESQSAVITIVVSQEALLEISGALDSIILSLNFE